MKKVFRYILAFLLFLGIIAIVSTVIYNYNVKPNKAYVVNRENLIEDGSFEGFNEIPGDCCNKDPNKSGVFASKSEESIEGYYSLNLTSENQCACINKPINDFNKFEKYYLSFNYKGDNPRYCNWVRGDNKCLPDQKFNLSNEWVGFRDILKFTEKSISSSIYFYADSDGTKTVTNLYDNLQVHRLIQIDPEGFFDSEEEYIFLTKADNNVYDAELISEIDTKTGEAYFLTKGKPNVTIKFPWSEVVIVGIIILIVIRLLFRRQEQKTINQRGK